jgi:hypothetical protein
MSNEDKHVISAVFLGFLLLILNISPSPVPTPVPVPTPDVEPIPDPTPDPQPVPDVAPIPEPGLHVMIIAESGPNHGLTREQATAVGSTIWRAKVKKHGGTFRVFDPDVRPINDADFWLTAFDKFVGSAPVVVVSNGKAGTVVPLESLDRLNELVDFYGGTQ